MATKDESVKIIPGTKFVVDGFQIKNKKDYKHYFLTHFHADHYAGLTKTWKHGTIYCTKATARLAQLKFNIAPTYFHTLELDTIYVIENVRVVLYDANHCPGSSCMLFETPDGKAYLHTGDMRFDKELFSTYETLKPYFRPQEQQRVTKKEETQEDEADDDVPPIKTKALDALYIDTTYCNPAYSFPKQTEATRFIADFVKSKLTSGDGKRYLFLFGTYQIGKERIAQRINESCGCKVYVTRERYQVLELLEVPYLNIFTTNPSQSQVHMIRMFDLAWNKLFELRRAFSGYDEIIAFRPSAWCFSEMDIPTSSDLNTSCSLDDHFDVDVPLPKNKRIDNEGFVHVDVVYQRRSNITVVSVPYSEHSSFAELKDCVQLLKVKELRPTVYKDQKDLMQIKNYLSEAFMHAPLKLKLSVPTGLLSNQGEKSTTKINRTFKKVEVTNNHKITNFFSVGGAIKSTVGAVASQVGKITSFFGTKQTENKVANANSGSKRDFSPPAALPKEELKAEVVEIPSFDDSQSGSNISNSIDIFDEDFVDLSQVNVSEQLHIMKTLEKQISVSSTSTSPSSSNSQQNKQKGKGTLRIKRKSTSSSQQSAKKQKIDQSPSITSFFQNK